MHRSSLILFHTGSDDGLILFHSNNESIDLDPDSSTVISIQFVPLKLNSRHCSIVLTNPELGDVVLSIIALVNKPLPMLPETLHHHHSTVMNSETNTLHLNTTVNSNVEEEIVMHISNSSLENALLEICKWEIGDNDLKRRLLAASLHYATLSSGVYKLQVNDFLEISQDGAEETVVFTIESSNKHFILPDHVNIPTAITGIPLSPNNSGDCLMCHANEEWWLLLLLFLLCIHVCVCRKCKIFLYSFMPARRASMNVMCL